VARVKRVRVERSRDRRPDCVFCRIVVSEAPVSKVFEDARTLAFMDVSPVRRGHVLVIPKAHRAQVWDMREAEFAAVYRRLPSLVRALARATQADAVDVLNLNGAAGGQTVYHVHFHLIPIHLGRSPLRRKGRRITFDFTQETVTRAQPDPHRPPHPRGGRGRERASREGQAGLRRANRAGRNASGTNTSGSCPAIISATAFAA
jgi:histidine triad (HIT) family protein